VWAAPSEPPLNPALFALFCLGKHLRHNLQSAAHSASFCSWSCRLRRLSDTGACCCCCCAGYALNLYWMQAILRGALRALSRTKASKEE
jgi:hypothetical protein